MSRSGGRDASNGQHSSSGGTAITAEVTPTGMYWSLNFGTMRGLGAIPGGRVELDAETTVSELSNPTALTYKHPLNRHLEVPEGGIIPGSRFNLVEGARIKALRCYTDGRVQPVGVDTGGTMHPTYIPAEGEERAQIRLTDEDGSISIFSAESGELLSYTSSDKQEITDVTDYQEVKRDATGVIRQIWNLWDGLLQVESVTDGNGYRIALYPPDQITGTDEQGWYTVTGAPFKTCILALDDNGRFSITEQTPGRQDYTVTWWKNGEAWNMSRGNGEEAIITHRTRTELEETDRVWQLVTEVTKNGNVAERTCAIYQSTEVGDLLLTQIEGYQSSAEQTTRYGYDQCGRLKTLTAPDGSVSRYSYDSYGREVRQETPWADVGKRITVTTYAHSGESDFNTEPATVTEELLPDEGHIKTLSDTVYSYTQSNHIKRTEKRVTGLGVTGTRLSVSEQWLATAENPYARGRQKLEQREDGVQTRYHYEGTEDYGALYTVTEETVINGELVNGQSTRRLTWIKANGQKVREEDYLLLSNGSWALTGSTDYEYDTQNRWVKRTFGNGRTSERELMCDGRILREIDEDGIQSDYTYDTARQLVEVTRSAVMMGEEATIITPETITVYTRDAVGRELSTRRDTGALSVTESTTYDLLGRLTSTTDVLGRTTHYAYSADGLTTTQTTPGGATHITRRAPDGTVLEESGTGQRHIIYTIDLVSDGVRTFTKAVSGETATELQRSIVNGVGETLRRAVPHTTGGFIYTRSTYNALGHLIKEQTDTGSDTSAMAPTLWEYDSFGNKSQETLLLAATEEEASTTNSRITEWSYGAEATDEGVFRLVTTHSHNAQGEELSETQKTLVSALSALLQSKVVTIDPRGNTSVQWSEYGEGACRTQKSTHPTSDITAQTVEVDEFTIRQQDHAGITSTQSRAYTESGIIYTQTDGRGHTTTTRTDTAGRVIRVTDAADHETSTQYDTNFDLPAVVTDALGNTTHFGYDHRGRKTAEWGTGTQPVTYAYDEADRMVRLTTFRVDAGDISVDPSGRTDGDTTTWTYHTATGLELRKTYADGSSIIKTYDSFNRLATETNARGLVKTFTYEQARGLLTAISYSDATPGQSYAYNHLGQLTQVTDAAGTRTLGYNAYNEPETDSLLVGNHTHLITEQKDAYGRSTGYIYARSGTAQHTVSLTYGTDGRMATASFLQGSAPKTFAWQYLTGSYLPAVMTMPNSMSLEWGYEEQRDLVTSMTYKRGATVVAARGYTYDNLGRPLMRQTTRQGSTVNDSFTYNSRSELTAATVNGKAYGYSYDNIGNRKTAQEDAEEATAYTANQLNQYTAIRQEDGEEETFIPTYDADGNQTRIKTATGIWNVTYNAENRPVRFESEDGSTVVECTYDYMGRRHTRKVTVNGTVSNYLRYIYRGYLQIAAIDAVSGVFRWFLFWDPTQPEATRPLAIRKDSTWYAYGWDLTKNITEIFGKAGYLRTAYTYTPYGEATAEGDVTQPFTWSSEYADDELGLIYYNYRCYNPEAGNWLARDPQKSLNLYWYVGNHPIEYTDYLGRDYCVSDFKRKIKLPKYKGSANAWPFSLDWGGDADLEICGDLKFGKIKGLFSYSFEFGLTGGFMFRKRIWGYDIYGLMGLRLFTGASGETEIEGKYDRNICSWLIDASVGGKVYFGAEIGALARVANRKGEIVYEIGAGGRASYNLQFGFSVKCTKQGCQSEGYFELSDTVDYAIFANLGWFEVSHNGEIEVKKIKKKFLKYFHLPLDAGKSCT